MIIYKNGILAQEGILHIGEYRTIRTIPHKFGVDASAIRMQITPDGRRSLSILDDVMGKMQNNNPGLFLGGVSVRWGYSVFRRLPSGRRCSCLCRVSRSAPCGLRCPSCPFPRLWFFSVPSMVGAAQYTSKDKKLGEVGSNLVSLQ